MCNENILNSVSAWQKKTSKFYKQDTAKYKKPVVPANALYIKQIRCNNIYVNSHSESYFLSIPFFIKSAQSQTIKNCFAFWRKIELYWFTTESSNRYFLSYILNCRHDQDIVNSIVRKGTSLMSTICSHENFTPSINWALNWDVEPSKNSKNNFVWTPYRCTFVANLNRTIGVQSH